MKFHHAELPGIFIIENNLFTDDRGVFVKVYHEQVFAAHGAPCHFQECFYSISHQNVIRGMHFQTPPFHNTRLVWVLAGAVRDVVVDIRQGSPTYSRGLAIELSADNGLSLLIPPGFAHGFAVLRPPAIVGYLQTSVYSQVHDLGVRYDSFGLDWGIPAPILSARDLSFPRLAEFDSPFIYKGEA